MLLVSCGSVAPLPTPITGANGAWSNPATWGGKLPNSNSSAQFADASKLNFKFLGGDQLRFERL